MMGLLFLFFSDISPFPCETLEHYHLRFFGIRGCRKFYLVGITDILLGGDALVDSSLQFLATGNLLEGVVEHRHLVEILVNSKMVFIGGGFTRQKYNILKLMGVFCY